MKPLDRLPSANTREILIKVDLVAKILFATIATLALLGISSAMVQTAFPDLHLAAFTEEFDLHGENNIPTYFSSLLLLAVSIVALGLALSESVTLDRYYYVGIAVLFLVLSIDEVASLHERLNRPIRGITGNYSWFRFAWVIPGAVLVGVVGIAYYRFVRRMPDLPRRLTFIAGALFVGGALGLELLEGKLASTVKPEYRDSGYYFANHALVITEELMEMLGAALFVVALLLILRRRKELRLIFLGRVERENTSKCYAREPDLEETSNQGWHESERGYANV
ncbi:MAG: hypothetical protein KJO98_01300 [Rhodothermia bacterium]|nr:hypothetical protein [Rhodothermia bacterium]NNE34086.1 hypothetical protein [Rhodothermales bacterium]